MKSFKNKKRENKWKVNINEDGQFIKYTMSESSQYYRVIKKIGFMNKVKEYWHKSAVCYPSQIFKTWNSLNENSKWDLENIAIKKQDHSLIFSINMKKNILE